MQAIAIETLNVGNEFRLYLDSEHVGTLCVITAIRGRNVYYQILEKSLTGRFGVDYVHHAGEMVVLG